MRLQAWLDLKKVKKAEFARKIDVAPPTITRIIGGTQNIPLSTAEAIFRETEGAVTADDLRAAYAEAQAQAAKPEAAE